MNKNKIANKKQKFSRITLEGVAFIHDNDHLYAAPLENLSTGGVFLSQLTTLDNSKMVKIVVKSNDLGTSFQACGKVVRVETQSRKGTAIEFIGLKTETRELIEKRVQEVLLEDELKLI